MSNENYLTPTLQLQERSHSSDTLMLNSQSLSQVYALKYLGVLLSRELSWSPHGYKDSWPALEDFTTLVTLTHSSVLGIICSHLDQFSHLTQSI